MKVSSDIYGSFDIDEPVLLELMDDRSLQRLKKVDMSGYTEPFWPEKKRNDRYSHSVDTMLLLRRYGAGIEEQISGLTHDVSHTALSHTSDYVTQLGGSPSMQNYQDNIFFSYVNSMTKIPSILKENGFDPKHTLDNMNFPLMEKSLPELCADRIAYAHRGGYAFGKRNLEAIEDDLRHLKVHDGEWAFDNRDSAMSFAAFFKEMNDVVWSGVPTAIMFNSGGKAIGCALNKNYITKPQLHTDDETLMAEMRKGASEDRGLKILLDRMEGKVACRSVDLHVSDCMQIVKSRAVDPHVIVNGGLVHLSTLDTEWGLTVERDLKPKTYYLKYSRE